MNTPAIKKRKELVEFALQNGWKVWGRFRRYDNSSYQCFRRGNEYAWIGWRFLEHSNYGHAIDFVLDMSEAKGLLMMTSEDFNQKYRKYCEKGFEDFGPLEFSIPEVTLALDAIFQEEFTKIPGFKVAQIKLKFGRARFHSNLPSELERMVEQLIDDIITDLNKVPLRVINKR